MDQDYGSGLWIRIMDPDYRSRNTDHGHERLKMDQDVTYFYTDNFSRDLRVEHFSYQALNYFQLSQDCLFPVVQLNFG